MRYCFHIYNVVYYDLYNANILTGKYFCNTIVIILFWKEPNFSFEKSHGAKDSVSPSSSKLSKQIIRVTA